MIDADGAVIPYPPLTQILHHEVETIVAMKSGGLRIPADTALITSTATPWASISRTVISKTPRARRSSLGRSQIVRSRRALQRAATRSKDRPSAEGRHLARGRDRETQSGDLAQMIWNVPEAIAQLWQQVALDAGDIIMTGTPNGVSPLQLAITFERSVAFSTHYSEIATPRSVAATRLPRSPSHRTSRRP